MVAQNKFSEQKKIGFDDSFAVAKCLHLIEVMQAFWNEQPSNIKTMGYTSVIVNLPNKSMHIDAYCKILNFDKF